MRSIWKKPEGKIPAADWCRKVFRSFSHIRFFIGFSFCLAVYNFLLAPVNKDEVEAVHTAWKISAGETIYRDFFQHHHPLFYYALVPLVIGGGGGTVFSFYIAEIFSFAVFSATVAAAFFLAEKIYNDRKTSLISVVLLFSFPFFIEKATEIRPDIFQVFFGLLSFYMLIVFLKGGTRKHFVLSALFLFLSFFSLQKAVFLVAVTGFVQLYYLFCGKLSKKNFFLYWAVFFCLFLLYLGFLSVSGSIQNYFDFNWLVNIKFLDSFSPFHQFRFTPDKKLFATLSMAGFLFLLFRGFFLEGRTLHKVAAFTGLFLLFSVFLVKTPFRQYFLMASPFMAIAAARSLRCLFTDSTIRIWLGAFVLCAASFLAGYTEDGMKKQRELSIIKYVHSVSKPGDVFMGDLTNLFRKDADFFWFCTAPSKCLDTYRTFRRYEYNPIMIINEKRPQVVNVRGKHEEKLRSVMENSSVSQHYKQSSEYGFLYLRKQRD